MTHPSLQKKPRSNNARSRLLRPYGALFLAGLMGSVVIVEGCGSSSPRFGNGETASSQRRTGPRFSREAQEERREDDRKPDPAEVTEIVSGKRDFRREKNEAIVPLDQSKMMRAISRYMGVPYAYGGAGSNGMDCSGYTMLVYKESMGRGLPRSAQDQYLAGSPVRFENLKFGDLVFFNTTGSPASHVGVYLGDDLFAHASVSLGVTISSLESSYYKKRYQGARRIVGGSD